jgi:phosphoglucomutase
MHARLAAMAALMLCAAPLASAGSFAASGPSLMPRLRTVHGRVAAVSSMHLRGGSDPLAVTVKPTAPIDGQKPGTSGLRKKTKEFMTENYLANFVQSVFSSLEDVKTPMNGGTLVISGDGRYFNRDAVQIIAKIAVAHGVSRLWIGQGALLSTPAASAVVRTRDGGFKAFGAFILSASHNPGGIDEDFGIKYNCENGGPAPEKVTDKIFEYTKSISEIKSAEDFPEIDIDTVGQTEVKGADGKTVTVEVFDCTEDHVGVLKECFDFDAIKKLFARKDFSFCYDALNGVQGPYAKKVFVETMGCDPTCLMNCDPKEDFGGPDSAHHGHADPNLAHARALCDRMCVAKDGAPVDGGDPPSFGAAADGDADRNMILGSRFFVNPSDSLAIIVDNAETCIPYFKPQKGLFGSKGGIKGAARSMPTSCALDLVCKAKNIPCFETPTGWKFFGNLMDTPKYTPFICGEESFGTGSNHIREKDGMWAVLAWLQILAHNNPDETKPLVTVQDIVEKHWKTYGRNYYGRYDYEGVEADAAKKMMAYLAEMVGKWPTDAFGSYTLDKADSFEYLDPIDGSLSKNQGMRFIFTDGSRIVFRVSGTGVVGATIRMYLEKYEPASGNLSQMPLEVVKELADIAVRVAKLQEFTGRDAPTLMT